LYLAKSAFRFFFLDKLPQKAILVKNPTMGTYSCRPNTTDFMYSFFSYEYRIKKEILKQIKSYNIYIDMGSCIGDYSIWMAKQGLECYAFEPVNENYGLLCKNIELNKCKDKVHPFNYALGSKEGETIFLIHPSNKGASSKYFEVSGSVKQKVEIKTFDQFIEDNSLSFKGAYIAKLDAEGMELEILKGAHTFLSNAKRIFLIIEATQTQRQDILDFLDSYSTKKVFYLDDFNLGVHIENKA
jgi:FkbM family methyltransferase